MATVTVTDSNFDSEVLKAQGKVLVDFWASWCGPCRMLGPIIDEIASENHENLKVCKLNVDENNATAGNYNVMSIPTMIIFENGKAVNKLVGVRPKAEILAAAGV